MATLLQNIGIFIDKISVTDKQEVNIRQSLSNIEKHLKNKGSNLWVKRTFTNGSYERDTIIRPLNDVDLFAVLDFNSWKDQYGTYPKPQAVLVKIKNYLNDLHDYKGLVKQDRPCVTIVLSDKNFDILPSFEKDDGGYRIPNYDLTGWTDSYPERLTTDLNNTNKLRNGKLKPTIKAIKYWNRANGKLIPSYHIEEAAINIFKMNGLINFEQSIRQWFNEAERNIYSQKMNTNDEYNAVMKRIKRDRDKLNQAKMRYDVGSESEAIKIWKDVFGIDFPA